MTSLATCIRKAGKALTREDAIAIREIMAEGGTAQNAVDEYIGLMQTERTELVSEIEAHGGRPGKLARFGGNLTMDDIDFNHDLPDRQLRHQQLFAMWATTTPWPKIKTAYLAMKGEATGNAEDVEDGRVLSVDAMRELYPPYLEDRSLANGTHEIASALIKKLYAEKLAAPAPRGERFLWTAGGTGAGKTTGLKTSRHARNAALIYDGNLGKFDSAVRRTDVALEAGKLVAINYVYRDPGEAYRNGVIKRAMNQFRRLGSGRTVQPWTHAATHAGSRDTITRLRDHYADNPRVIFEAVNNSNGRGLAEPSKIDALPKVDKAAAEAIARRELEAARNAGEINEKIYAQFLETRAGGTQAPVEGGFPSNDRQSEQGGAGAGSALYSRTAEKLDLYANPEGRPRAPEGELEQPIPHNATQEEKYEIARALAEENKLLIDPIVERISTRLGIEIQTNIKTKEAAIGKANRSSVIEGKNRPWWNLEYERDIFRFRALLNDVVEGDVMMNMLNDALQPLGGLVSVKSEAGKYGEGTSWGWRPLVFDLQMPNGQITEFYMAPKEMIAVADKEGHWLFERWRLRDVRDLTARERGRYVKDVQRSNHLYGTAYREYLQRTQRTAADDFASARNVAAIVESFTSVNSSAKSAPSSPPGGSGIQTPSADLNANRSSSSTNTRSSTSDLNTVIPGASLTPFPVYSRADGTAAVKKEELQLALAPAIRALVGTAQAHIVQSVDDIPKTLDENGVVIAIPTDVEGVYRGGNEFWLVADTLPSAARAKMVFAHEGFGHLAMERMPEFQDVLASVRNMLAINNKTFTDVAASVAVTQGNLPEETQLKEILAYMAEHNMENGVMARAYAAVRSALRRMGLLDGATYSEAEIKDLLVRGARSLVDDAAAKQKALAAMPAQQQILEDPQAVEQTIMLAIEEIYANAALQELTLRAYSEITDLEGNMNPAAQERLKDLKATMYRAEVAPGVAPDVMDPEAMYSRAYHGTAATFDSFDLKYMSSGEGFQAFGWGLYFSSSRGVAEWYQRTLAGPEFTFKGKRNTRARIQKMIQNTLAKTTKKNAPKTLASPGSNPNIAAGSIARGVVGMMGRHNGSLTDTKAEVQQQIDNFYESAELNDSLDRDWQEMRNFRAAEKASGEFAGFHEMDAKVDRANVDFAGMAERDRMVAAGWEAAYKLVDDGKISYEGAKGNLMEVEVPDNDDLIHYEDTLNEHSPEVVAKIKERFPELFEIQWTDTVTGEPIPDEYIDTLRNGGSANVSRKASGRGWQRVGEAIAKTEADLEALGFTKDVPAESMTGDQFYRYVGNKMLDQKLPGIVGALTNIFSGTMATVGAQSRDRVASEYIRDTVGIPGHSFVGGESNQVNYVIYDDAQIQMTHINDVAVEVADAVEEVLYSRSGVGAETADNPAVPGKPFLVYRLAAKSDTSLRNANAGNAMGVATHLMRADDMEGPRPEHGFGDFVHVYEVTVDAFGAYDYFRSGNNTSELGSAGVVGRTGDESISYSFPDSGYQAKHVAKMAFSELRETITEMHKDDARPEGVEWWQPPSTFDDLGSRAGGELITSESANLFSRAGQYLQINDRQKNQPPQLAAKDATPRDLDTAMYWVLASEAGTRAFSAPKGSWEERYYSEIGRQASAAAKTANQQAPMPEEQMALFSRSPEFKAWFGNSKVVNEDGSPQQVYHGSQFTKPFEVFDPQGSFGGWNHVGTWFSSVPKHAEIFANTNPFAESGQETGQMIPAYLSIQNPLEGTFDELVWRMQGTVDKAGTDQYSAEAGPAFKAELQKLGYDGMIVRNWEGDSMGGTLPPQDVFVALESNQIKSSIGNVGTYDATNPNILYSRKIHSNPEIERIRDKVLTPALEDITIKDRVRSLVERVKAFEWLSVKQGIVNDIASVMNLEEGIFDGHLLDASQSPSKAILATRNLGSVMAAIMHRGIPIYQNGVFTARTGRKGLIDIFQKITHHKDGNLLPLWELYAVAKRSQRLIQEKNRDGTSKEKVLTQQDINTAMTLEIEYPEFKEVHAEWQAFNSQLLDLAIKRGVINGHEAKVWRQNDYVPFYRAMEEIEYQGGQAPQVHGEGVGNVRSGIKRLSGSEAKIGNVFENMVQNTAYLIDAVYRNTAMQRVVLMADGIAMHKVPMAFEAVRFNDADLARALMKAGLIVGNGIHEADMFNDGIRQVGAMTQAQKDHWSVLFRKVAPQGPNIISVLEQGKPVYYEVEDPLLLRALGAMGAQQWGGIMHTFRFAKRTLTKMVTIDPAFMMANFLRDTLSTAVVVKGSGAKQILGAIKGLRDAFNEDPDIMAMMMAGAGGGGFYDHNPADVRKMLAKKMPAGKVGAFTNSIITPRGAYRAWQKIGNASEQANRVALYKRIIAEGGTPAEAAYQARDVLNFTMTGDYAAMKFLVQTVPFLNARIQGLYRLGRGGMENPIGFAMKGAAITMATVALLMKNQDDDRYKELPEWDKDTYWHFFVGDEHLRLPKPFEVGAIFATIPERMIMLGTGDDDLDVTVDRLWRMAADTMAFNPVPQLLKPMTEQWGNRNMFTGNPIIGLHHQGLEPEAQYDPWTSETMRELAKVLPGWGGSPKRLESFARGYFGAVGMYLLSASDEVTRRAFGHPDRPTKGVRNWPVVTRFVRDQNPRTSKYSNQMYDMMHEADALYRTMNAYRKQGRMEEARDLMEESGGKLQARKFLHSIATRVRDINTQLKRAQYSDMSPDKKKAAVDKLNAAKRAVMSRVARVSDLF